VDSGEFGSMKVGDLVKYLSRTLLIVGFPSDDPDWVECIELGETTIGKYRQSILEVLNDEDR
jgi:hypothetical protein